MKIPVRLEENSFRKFGVFDNITLNRRWLPSLAAGVGLAVMGGFCLVVFRNAQLFGGVLLCLGLGMPASWFIRFYQGLGAQVKRNGLETPKLVYNVLLLPEGVQQWMKDGTDKAGKSPVVSWDKVFGAWRTGDAVYLYVLPNRALLLPEGGIPVSQEEVWQYLKAYLPEEKLHRV